MRTTERLRKLKTFVYKELCKGREMKTLPDNLDVSKIVRQEPKVYLAWHPSRPGLVFPDGVDPINVCPGIVIMPAPSTAKYVEEKRFDRYSNVHRPQEMGSLLSVSMLFSVYEAGIRLPGFNKDGKLDISKIQEGTEEGLFTLYNWMDDCIEAFLRERTIPGTDLVLSEADLGHGLFTDQSYVVDKRPIYYGFVNAKFYGYAEEGNNKEINDLIL